MKRAEPTVTTRGGASKHHPLPASQATVHTVDGGWHDDNNGEWEGDGNNNNDEDGGS